MLEYRTFVYLQNHKTGCTFVSAFLKTFSDETLHRKIRHHAPRKKKPGRFYFMNVREPLDNYLSLFGYGVDDRGAVHKQLAKRGHEDIYKRGVEGFGDWLEAMLDPDFAGELFPEYAEHSADMGLATWRFKRLAQFRFAFDEPAVDYVIRNETLTEDLASVVQNQLAHAISDQQSALAWIAETRKINTSSRQDKAAGVKVRREVLARFLDREKWLYDTFYREEREKLQAALAQHPEPGAEIHVRR